MEGDFLGGFRKYIDNNYLIIYKKLCLNISQYFYIELNGVQGVGGSNPLIPTRNYKDL